MENNYSECIEEIAKAGRRFVEEEYRFEKVVERWESILQDIE